MLQSVMPEIKDYWFPWEGVFHNIVVVALQKEYPGHAQKLMSGLWGQGQMSFCKAIVVVDDSVDPSNAGSIAEALVEKLDLEEDLTVAKGVLDVLDHSAPSANFGHKIGVDLTRRFPGEPPRAKPENSRTAPSDDSIPKAVRNIEPVIFKRRVLFAKRLEKPDARNRLIALCVQKTDRYGGREIAKSILSKEELADFNIIILYDRDIDLDDNSLILWKLFNNVDPKRDIVMKKSRIAIDACKKGLIDGHNREWPEDLTFDIE
jgi:4-hydroxy-3-polyprenylbenzoate decarboxylase